MPAEPKDLTAWERWEMGSLDTPAGMSRIKPSATSPNVAGMPPVVLPTAAEIEQMHQQAQEEGHRLGYAEGRQQALAEASRLAGITRQLDVALMELDQQVGDELLALAIEIARRIVDQALVTKPEVIRDAVRLALAELPHQHAVIHVHPDDAELLHKLLGDQLSHAGHRIHEDATVSRGGCLVEAGGSQVDATLRTRWRRVLESIGTPVDWIEEAEK